MKQTSHQNSFNSFMITTFLVYLFHITSFFEISYSDTVFHQKIVSGDYSALELPLVIIITIILFYYTTLGPGFVESETQSLSQEDTETRYCEFCDLNPPMRSSHCKKCNRCVLRRDHHCPWVGTCVGMDNHLFFIGYLFFETICTFQIAFQVWPITKIQTDFLPWLFTGFLSAVLIAACAIIIFQSIALLPFHVFISLLNRTTWEMVRSSRITYLRDWRHSYSPFSHGLIKNIKEFVTMRWNHPIYSIPKGEDLEQWKEDNSFFFNDSYECC